MTKFETISLPKEMLEYIDELRAKSKIRRKYHFSSRAHFIKMAISEFICRLETEIEKAKELET